LILFPTEDSITVKEFQAKHPQQDKYHLVIIEATWNLAKAINRKIPCHYPRVRLTNSSRNVFGGSRKLSNKPRVCTAGAFHHLLGELGEKEEDLQSLSKSIHHLFETHSVQAGKERLVD
jgi:DTW domain-containing protein YfiP